MAFFAIDPIPQLARHVVVVVFFSRASKGGGYPPGFPSNPQKIQGRQRGPWHVQAIRRSSHALVSLLGGVGRDQLGRGPKATATAVFRSGLFTARPSFEILA